MLVLSRGVGERIRIGDDVIIEVVRACRDGKVRIGIIAPPEVNVHRGEVYDAIRRENAAAAQVRVGTERVAAGAAPGGGDERGG